MKKITSLLIIAILVFAMTACGKKAEPQEPEKQTTVEETQTQTDSIKKTAYDITGYYSCDQLGPNSDTVDARSLDVNIYAANKEYVHITVLWGKNAFEGYKWEMAGIYDSDTDTITYLDAEKAYKVLYDDSEERTLEYIDGSGTMVLSNNKLIWNDDKENIAENLTFTRSSNDQ